MSRKQHSSSEDAMCPDHDYQIITLVIEPIDVEALGFGPPIGIEILQEPIFSPIDDRGP